MRGGKTQEAKAVQQQLSQEAKKEARERFVEECEAIDWRQAGLSKAFRVLDKIEGGGGDVQTDDAILLHGGSVAVTSRQRADA